MLDLSPFDTLLYWYPSFVSGLLKSEKNSASIPLKLSAVYEITYDLVQEEFYHQVYRLVENTVHQYLNDVQSLTDKIGTSDYKYILHQKAGRPLELLLFKLQKIICEEENSSKDRKICLEIVQHFLVWCYAEICEKRLELLKEEEVPLFQIYHGYLQINEPLPPIIHERISKLETQLVSKQQPLIKESVNAPRITFEQLIQMPDSFQSMEKLMMENNLIDENRKLVAAHGNKNYLAAVYVQLIQKGYFQKRIFPGNIEIRLLDIRRFLDNRYDVKLPKQFNYWVKNKKKHTEFIQKYYWLENLQPCISTK